MCSTLEQPYVQLSPNSKHLEFVPALSAPVPHPQEERARLPIHTNSQKKHYLFVSLNASIKGIVLASLHLLQTGDANSQQCIQTSPVVTKRQIIIAAMKTSHAAKR